MEDDKIYGPDYPPSPWYPSKKELRWRRRQHLKWWGMRMSALLLSFVSVGFGLMAIGLTFQGDVWSLVLATINAASGWMTWQWAMDLVDRTNR